MNELLAQRLVSLDLRWTSYVRRPPDVTLTLGGLLCAQTTRCDTDPGQPLAASCIRWDIISLYDRLLQSQPRDDNEYMVNSIQLSNHAHLQVNLGVTLLYSETSLRWLLRVVHIPHSLHLNHTHSLLSLSLSLWKLTALPSPPGGRFR